MDNGTIKDYRLLQVLGEGAAGKVYLATATKEKPFANRGDPLALKIYKSDVLNQPGQAKRIQREFEVGSTLAHPGLVKMFDYFPGDSQTSPFLVMEYVDGITLDEWLKMYHPVSGRLLLRIVDELLNVLEYVHSHDIIHRDLKPKNIMLNSAFEPKLMDFGVVRITKDSLVTPKDKFLGTIRNASPELLFGKDYTAQTDLYSLGTVIYALLYGEEVFAEEQQFARLVDLVKNELPRLDPSAASRDEVSAALFEITRSLLEKDLAQRPTSVAQIQGRLAPIRPLVSSTPNQTPLHGYIATALTGLQDDAKEAIVFASSKIAEVARDYEL